MHVLASANHAAYVRISISVSVFILTNEKVQSEFNDNHRMLEATPDHQQYNHTLRILAISNDGLGGGGRALETSGAAEG